MQEVEAEAWAHEVKHAAETAQKTPAGQAEPDEETGEAIAETEADGDGIGAGAELDPLEVAGEEV